jgi:hypothetical protein
MGRSILAVVIGLIVAPVVLGFTIWLGLAIAVLTVGQPNEAELYVLGSVAFVAAIGSGIFIGRRIAIRR